MSFFSSLVDVGKNLVGSVTGGDLLSAGTSVLGSLMSNSGQAAANRAAQASTKEQMDFQERMRDTAHQAEVKDLIAAGLNPVLSAGGSGASSPSGSSYTPVNEKATAADIALKTAQLRNLNAQTKKTEADARLSNAEADKSEVLKSPYTAVANAIPKIKSTAKDMADFYTGDSELSPRGIYNWITRRSSTARDIEKVDVPALARGLKPFGISIQLPGKDFR